MFSKLKEALSQFLKARATDEAEEPSAAAVEYKGYRIRPTPYLSNGRYQTSGIIEKDSAEGVKVHKFIRADTYQGKDDAITFTIAKAKMIIDQQGDSIFT